jgi:formylglycine-generating enzyme required for sulfatase activity
MEFPANFLERTGYRLPTSTEWEFACRGGSIRSRCYGDDPKLLPEYAWFNSNGEYRSHPVGSLLPNAYGLFDMHGNILEWTHNYYFDDLPKGAGKSVIQDIPDPRLGSERELRGGHFESPPLQVRAADREYDVESMTSFYIGFRIAKTMK